MMTYKWNTWSICSRMSKTTQLVNFRCHTTPAPEVMKTAAIQEYFRRYVISLCWCWSRKVIKGTSSRTNTVPTFILKCFFFEYPSTLQQIKPNQVGAEVKWDAHKNGTPSRQTAGKSSGSAARSDAAVKTSQLSCPAWFAVALAVAAAAQGRCRAWRSRRSWTGCWQGSGWCPHWSRSVTQPNASQSHRQP